MDEFLSEIFPNEMIWEKLRKNATTVERFILACHQKVDGLRILQYLKWRHRQSPVDAENSLIDFLETFYPDSDLLNTLKQTQLNFSSSSIVTLNQIRDFLVEKEDAFLSRQ
jgi:hypothetical protein